LFTLKIVSDTFGIGGKLPLPGYTPECSGPRSLS